MATHSEALDVPHRLRDGGFEISNRAVQVWWATFLLLTPFYVFRSGIPQPADFYLVATFPFIFLIWINRIPKYPDLWLAASLFVVYVTCVNMFWFTAYYSTEFLMSALYYIFDVVLVLIVVTAFAGNPAALARVTRQIFVVLLSIEAGVVAIIGDEGYGRAMGTFNDPNQMGYWALLTVVCVFALRTQKTLQFIDLVSLALAGFVILMSVSRAAMLGFVALLIVLTVFSKLRLRMILVVLTIAFAFAVLAGAFHIANDYYLSMFEFMKERFASRRTENDSLVKRSLERLWLFPQHLLFGAGDGEYSVRFRLANETHSTLASILFCYGFVGLSLFIHLLYVVVRQASWFRIMLLGPVMVYGLAQQGARFSLFWILLALVFATSQEAEPDGGGNPTR